MGIWEFKAIIICCLESNNTTQIMPRCLRFFSSMLMLSLLLMGCSTQSTAKITPNSYTVSNQALPVINKNLGQNLPISAIAIVANGTKIELEVARTLEQQEMGLMYRPPLPANRGMLFQFSSPSPESFWMKNTPVPLDIVFLRKGVVQYIAASVPPCTTNSCPTYGPRTLVDQVIELHSGRAKELNLKIGSYVKINALSTGNFRL